MNRRFTKEELEQLQVAEIHFRTVINSAYKRATGNKLDTLVADLYDKATGGKIQRNFSCGICSFNMYKQIGEKYYADKKYYETVEIEPEPKSVTDTLSTDNEDIENNTATDKDKTLSLADTLTDKDKTNDSEGKKQRNKGYAKGKSTTNK